MATRRSYRPNVGALPPVKVTPGPPRGFRVHRSMFSTANRRIYVSHVRPTSGLEPRPGGHMTIETSDPQSATGSKASVAADESKRVGSAAVGATQGVAQEAKTQASNVVGEAKVHLSSLVDQTKQELRTQMDSRSQQAVSGLQTLSTQLTALKEGRMEEAGRMQDILGDVQQRVQRYSQSVQQRGPNALIDDVTNFARRRPMVFLLGAVMGGFAVGRLVRAGA